MTTYDLFKLKTFPVSRNPTRKDALKGLLSYLTVLAALWSPAAAHASECLAQGTVTNWYQLEESDYLVNFSSSRHRLDRAAETLEFLGTKSRNFVIVESDGISREIAEKYSQAFQDNGIKIVNTSFQSRDWLSYIGGDNVLLTINYSTYLKDTSCLEKFYYAPRCIGLACYHSRQERYLSDADLDSLKAKYKPSTALKTLCETSTNSIKGFKKGVSAWMQHAQVGSVVFINEQNNITRFDCYLPVNIHTKLADALTSVCYSTLGTLLFRPLNIDLYSRFRKIQEDAFAALKGEENLCQ